MTRRHRSHDQSRDTDAYHDTAKTPAQQGRAGGGLERKVGTRDDLKRARHDRPGTTRVTKADEKGQGNLGGHHGTGQEE